MTSSHRSEPTTTKAPGTFSVPSSTLWRKALVSLPRLVPDAVLKYTSPEGPHPFVIEVTSREKRKIPCYVFVPSREGKGDKPLPVVIDHHGGGFVFGSCQEQAPFCAQLSRQLNAIVISVDYALGPYLQFPSANYDAEDVVDAVLDKREPRYEELRTAVNKELKKLKKQPVTIDAEHIAVSGFSSGGNLALNLALSIKPPTLDTAWLSPFPRSFPNKIPFLLFYPSLDARQLPSERPLPEGMPKKEKKGLLKSFDLEQNLMPTYLPREKAAHPRASPGLIPRGEEGLHPKAEILLYLPGYDSLSHQSQEWIKAMEVDKRKEVLKVVEVPGVVHGFNIFPDQFLTPEHRVLKRESYDLAVAFIREKWGM